MNPDPATMDFVVPSAMSPGFPASIQPIPTALHHSRLQSRRLGHHGLTPRRIKYEFDVGFGHGGDDFNLVADVLDEGKLLARLRGRDLPVIARVQEGRVLIDLRTVFAEQDNAVAAALSEAAE